MPAILGQIKDNKDYLLSIIDESSKLKDNISKNIDAIKKINKLDKQRRSKGNSQSRSEGTEEKVKQQEEASKGTTALKQQESQKTSKKEIINEIYIIHIINEFKYQRKKHGFYDIHT